MGSGSNSIKSPAPSHSNPKLPTVNLQYESVDGPQHTVTDQDYI